MELKAMQKMIALGLACCTIGFGAFAARADSSPAVAMLGQEISSKVPSNWQVHVSWRGDQLLAFVTPPYQEAFNLWYEPEKLRAVMLDLCPGAADAIWARLGPGKQIAVEPTVGGKSGESMRLVCPHGARPAA
jgi:hypothetical protein